MHPDEPVRSKGEVSVGQVVELLGSLIEEGLQCHVAVRHGTPSIVTVIVRDLTPALTDRICARLRTLDARITVIEDPSTG
ncbi:hypothetical protein [Methylobacterium frigidaeris]|uniref:hypothetical protein n=1 Tax=Methylobacterium frigidaeris TaxID=2038277 RepID=UPI0010550B56|nr:hypothetical protein [Methylobacterium frigidaeris]